MDASKSDASISDKLPSTQLGFIKVSHVLIAMDKYAELIDPNTRFVDPFKTAEMHRNAEPVTYVMPGSNIQYLGSKTVKDGFRRAVYDQLSANRRGEGSSMILTNTLLSLNNNKIFITVCSSCGSKIDQIEFTSQTHIHPCPHCRESIYITDWLRLHEGISDFGDNGVAMTRLMNAVEHLLLSAFVEELLNSTPAALSKIAFIIDGPLALFGEPAKLHQRLMALIYSANKRLSQLGLHPTLVMGLQKTGNVMDHARLLKTLPNGVLRVIDDNYRHTYITGSDIHSDNFGNETYYGQDFLSRQSEEGSSILRSIPFS